LKSGGYNLEGTNLEAERLSKLLIGSSGFAVEDV
jgi:hypothetical protein